MPAFLPPYLPLYTTKTVLGLSNTNTSVLCETQLREMHSRAGWDFTMRQPPTERAIRDSALIQTWEIKLHVHSWEKAILQALTPHGDPNISVCGTKSTQLAEGLGSTAHVHSSILQVGFIYSTKQKDLSLPMCRYETHEKTETLSHIARMHQTFPCLALMVPEESLFPRQPPHSAWRSLCVLDQLQEQTHLSPWKAATLSAAISHHHIWGLGDHPYRHVVSTFLHVCHLHCSFSHFSYPSPSHIISCFKEIPK